jgi:four helix bundle protein
MRNFEELDAWKLGREYKKSVRALTRSFPKHEQFKLTEQLIEASRSITANIAEGWGRYHYQENIQFCRIARGSLLETLDHLIEAMDCDYIDEDALLKMRQQYGQVLQVLNGYIGFLQRQKKAVNS